MATIVIGLFYGIVMKSNISKLLLLFLIISLFLSQWIIEISKIGTIFIHLYNIIRTIMYPPQQDEVSHVTTTASDKHYLLIDSVLSMCSVCNAVLSLLKTGIINLIGTTGDEDDNLPSLSIGIIICCVLKPWGSSPLLHYNNGTTADTRRNPSGESPHLPPTTPHEVPQQQEDKHDVSAASQRITIDEVSQLSSDNNNNNCHGCGSTTTNTIIITIIDLKNVFKQLFISFTYLSIVICIINAHINDGYGNSDSRNELLCIRNIMNCNFCIIMGISCIDLIKILLKCFQTFQIILKLIFYVFIYIAIDWTMTGEICNNHECGNNCQRPLWSNMVYLM